MTSPIGGPPPPQVPPNQPEAPALVINIPSPTIFGLMRGFIQVIHAAHVYSSHQNQGQTFSPDRSFRPMAPSGSILRHAQSELEEIELLTPQVRPVENIDKPQPRNQERSDPKEPTPPSRGRQELPPGFEVPDLTENISRSVSSVSRTTTLNAVSDPVFWNRIT